jgi:hypothetical protein
MKFLVSKKGVVISDLYQYILMFLIIGMLVGIGIVLFDAIGSATFYSSNTNNTLTGSQLTNNSLTALGFGNITSAAVWNGTTNSLNPTCYELNQTFGQFSFRNKTADCGSVNNVNVVYNFNDYDTQTKKTFAFITDATATITNNWVALIILIVVMAIIIGLVLSSFAGIGGQGR